MTMMMMVVLAEDKDSLSVPLSICSKMRSLLMQCSLYHSTRKPRASQATTLPCLLLQCRTCSPVTRRQHSSNQYHLAVSTPSVCDKSAGPNLTGCPAARTRDIPWFYLSHHTGSWWHYHTQTRYSLGVPDA